MKQPIKQIAAALLCLLLLASPFAGWLQGASADGERQPYDGTGYTVENEGETPTETGVLGPEITGTTIGAGEPRTAYEPTQTFGVGEAEPEQGGDPIETPFAVGEITQSETFDPGEDAPNTGEAPATLSGGFGTLNEEVPTMFGGGAAMLSGNTAPRQLTIEDIYAMNPNSTVIDLYTNDGYLSTLIGKFYDQKVTNVEEGVLAVQGVASLLGLSKGCDFFAVYSERNDTGYTFYTYQQRYGGLTLRYATMRIVVDPDGYTAGLTCSFVPNVGTASTAPKITAQEAEEIVRKRYADRNLTYYPEHTVQVAAPFGNMVRNCWVVYTNNPDATASFDMPYLEHFVRTDGVYELPIPANTFAHGSGDAIDNSGYFAGMDVRTYARTVLLMDGTTRDVSVPVSYNTRDQKYYLMDPSRKIAVAQYYDFNYRNETVNFVTSDRIDGWSDNNLIAYANYIILYDFYADHGIRSVDGFGTPILVTVGWCEEDGSPVNNACFYGVNNGWACFGVSDINHFSDCVDAVGHEYTHGVTRQSMQGVVYNNETGAINEAYSDIMGNLAEMRLDYTTDRTWKLAERSGAIERDMGNPNDYGQPGYVGDRYYQPSTPVPDFDLNDYGGVHQNNSLIGHIAYLMDQEGMTYEQQIAMWLTSIEILTPRSDYQDLHGALLFALKINGMLESFGPALNRAFAAAGLTEDWTVTYSQATKEGCGRLLISEPSLGEVPSTLLVATTDGKIAGIATPDASGLITTLLPENTYIAQLLISENGGIGYYNYTDDGWLKGGRFAQFAVKNGATVELPNRSGAAQKKELKLNTFDGGYFSMLVPDGWRMEQIGEYAYFSIKIFDPDDPSTQMFFYGGVNPFHKSQSARNFWKRVDSTGGMIASGPVLPAANIVGVLGTWDYCIAYQQYFDRQAFTDLYDFAVRGAYYYTGPYARLGAIESGAYVTCRTNWDDDCRLAIAGALIDYDTLRTYGGNWFYTMRDMCGILAPDDRYDEVFETLLTCLKSIRFSQEYIDASYRTGAADYYMPSQTEFSAGLETIGEILTAMHEKHK